jgi:hypothetical protein
MANNLTGNPLVVDTAAALISGMATILAMEWIPNAAADDLTVTDGTGKTIWDVDALTGGTAGKEKFPLDRFVCTGLTVSVIDGGTLYVYIK